MPRPRQAAPLETPPAARAAYTLEAFIPASVDAHTSDLVVAISPFETPNSGVVIAALRAGALGVLDLGRDRPVAIGALADLRGLGAGEFGVRVPTGCPVQPVELPGAVTTVILGAGPDQVDRLATWAATGARLLVEVVSKDEARVAAAHPAVDGLIAKGSEAGGWVGEVSSFVLLQQLMAEPGLNCPVWVAGGIGIHTAAGAVAGGARGVVLDSQLALTTEAAGRLPGAVLTALGVIDGSETAVLAGHRVLTRPGLVAGRPAPDSPATMAGAVGTSVLDGWLPAGQDAAFARPLAERYRTVGGVVQAVRTAIADHIAAADRAEPLRPGNGLFAAHPGAPALPVAQGPMTRVSDRAAFASAVAGCGGLPFLALALLRGPEVTALLAETSEALGDRPWGVGILGFVPAELRAEQLEAVRAARPPFALIAGGRPGQAAGLEADGIATFLHVPSPGLLDAFLAAGARRFVFEGSECGGHIGPRASFPLWEAQIGRLLAFAAAHPSAGPALEILFAGGIHDARSAAMVAVVAAPLVAAGARIGVLMGTAYLFTEEAVGAGAILPGFQDAALACTETVLLETSPGHITRCARTPFVEAFAEARESIAARGAAAHEQWAELEALNLGRLRIASKGVRREGDRIVAVAEQAQRDDGMFMLGQVATLRAATTTIRALHDEVTVGATQFLRTRVGIAGASEHSVGISTESENGVDIAGACDEAARATIYPAAGGSPAQSFSTAGVAVRADSRTTGLRAAPMDIAICGMACVLPQAGGLASYWANIVAGRDAVTELPPGRWDPSRYYKPEAYTTSGGSATPSKWGGFIPPVPFDALAFGIPPSSLAAIEPVQLLALEVAARALADAGYDRRPFDRERAACVFGADGGSGLQGMYGFRALYPSYFGALPPELDAHLPHLTEDSFPGVLANVIAGRIANRLDLGGVNFTVDAACASSLAALDVACKELVSGTSDLVLCGGADLHNGIYDYLMFAAAHALSPTGRCRTFDASADGIALGEGVVCVVLKRRADAERDGDRIYALVQGVAGSSDGKSLGLTAPRAEGQKRALARAYAAAGVSPASVGLVEAHGTGTVVGDRTELASLTDVFGSAGAQPGACSLGSVKSQIGHTKCAAGLSGLVKVAQALHTGVRPPTGRIAQPNPGWDAATSPFAFDQEARPWAAEPGERFAGVSAFGFGGTNFHAVLQGYDGAEAPAHGLDEWPAELFCFGGATPGDTDRELDRLAALATANDAAGRPWTLRDLAATTAVEPGATVRLAWVAESLDDLAGKLATARQRLSHHDLATDRVGGVFARGAAERGDLAFLFPGQGSQRPGMLGDLFVAFPRLGHLLRGDAAPYAGLLFPPAAFTPAGKAAQRAAVTDTTVAQPVMGIGGLAVFELLTGLGLDPAMAAGHSYGELVALAAAGAIRSPDLLHLGAARGAAILQAAGEDPGTMAAVKANRAAVETVLAAAPAAAGNVVIANDNAPDQVVISGPSAAVAAALAALEAEGVAGRPIPVACAFHSPVVAGAAPAFAAELVRLPVTAPRIPVWSNTTGEPHGADPDAIRALLARQVAEPVRFVDEIEGMYAAGARVFVECGPGRVLTGLVGSILAGRPHTAVAVDIPGEPGLRRLLLALAELAAAGIPMDTRPLYAGRDIQPARLDAVPKRPGWTVDGHMVRTVAGDPVPGGLQAPVDIAPPAGAPAPEQGLWGAPVPAPALPTALPTVGPAVLGDRDGAVLEYLRFTREVVAAQRDVMLAYLGQAPVTGGAAPAPPQAVLTPPAAPPTAPVTPEPEPAAAHLVTPGPAAGWSEEGITGAILSIVARRTGYPAEMLGAQLDLEADLSIDSIKRTEIVMELGGQLPLSGELTIEALIEGLSRLKTIAAMTAWILAHRPPQAGTGARPAPAAVPAAPRAPEGRPRRFLVEVNATRDEPATGPAAVDVAGKRFVVIDGGSGAGEATRAALASRGAHTELIREASEEACAGIDGLVLLEALRPGGPPVLPRAFGPIRAALVGGARILVLATGTAGRFGASWDGTRATDPTPGLGIRGLARTIAREYPNADVRAVDIDLADPPERIAEHLLAGLGSPRRHSGPVVGYMNGTRSDLRVVAADFARPSEEALPATLRAAASALGLTADSVVLITGGGRGITAACAAALAGATHCRIELLGRTPLPEGTEAPETAAAPDAAALRASLARRSTSPAEIEATVRRILAAREVRSTVTRLGASAASVRYHAADVTDPGAVRRVVDDIRARWGRLDGIIHGAGVLEDRLLADKTPESFARVFATKVDGARALLGALAGEPPIGFFALFGSVSGVFGNPGQADYAAANDALDTLARMWSGTREGRVAHRVVALDWGPWTSRAGGMVTPELEREYARRGIALISAEHGATALLSELAWGDPQHCQVLYLGGGDDPFAFIRPPAAPEGGDPDA